jgi:hypothetical protein
MDTARKLFLGIKQIKSFKEIFSNREVIAFFVSHDNYLGPGLAARIAFKYKIPVYLLNSKEILQPSRSFEIYERFSRYREYFDAFEATKKRDLLNKAEIAINSRLDGRVGIDMPYQISSAFENTQTKKQLPPRDNGVRVLIAVHDFFDNPHAYSRMMFRDFWIWLEFLGKVSEETNYLWCIKMHRDFSIPERRAVALFLRKFPKIIYVDPQTSFYQLAEEGITHVLTCHGTVGHELPLLGINVINCAFNPHVAYSFCETYLDIERYRERLSNLSNDDQPKAIGDIKEFYAVHYFHVNKSDFIYPAENSYLDADGALFNFTSALEWPIHNFELVSDRTLTVFQDCIRSGRVFSQESILPDKMQRISLFRNSSNGLRNALDVIYDRTDANG